MKRCTGIIVALSIVCMLLTGCMQNVNTAQGIQIEKLPQPEVEEEATSDSINVPDEEEDNIAIILYTNDIHGHLNNTKKDENGNEIKGWSFSKLAALKSDLIDAGENVLLADAGDVTQGTEYVSIDYGKTFINLMSLSGYDVAAPGNHEFDYGIQRAMSNMAKAAFPYISCNFFEMEDGDIFLTPIHTFQVDDKMIAFVGISTPETLMSTTPTAFKNEGGEYVCKFYGNDNPEDLYAYVQASIDMAKDLGADYIIGLGHLGVEDTAAPFRSYDVIKHSVGFDAFIDGHSHTTMEKDLVKDAEGKMVPLTQTGCHFAAFGKMTLKKDGSIETELISDYDKYDTMVRKLEQRWIDAVNLQLGDEIASTDFNLAQNNPDDPEERIIRNRETNLGDICADAIYSYYNVAKNIPCDLAIVNGGGIRAEVNKGPITYLDCKSVHPFGNLVCLVKIKGQQVLDMLEWSNRLLGEMDTETGKEAEIGSFLHCAGMKYTTDTTIKDTEIPDENGNWAGTPLGEYRTKDVMIFNRETGEYEPLDPEKTYNVAGQNYLLRSLGGGLNMLAESELVEDFSGEDYIILSEYLANFKKDDEGIPQITTEGSPLKKYEGYELDYENPYGSGRISIIKE